LSRPWELRIDTGGTFTDCLARDPAGRLHRAKVLSTSALRATVRRVARDGDAWRLDLDEGWGAPPDFPIGFAVHLDGGRIPAGRATGFEPDAAGGGSRLYAVAAATASHAGRLRPGSAIELRSPEPAPLLAARLVTGTPHALPLPEIALRLATTRGTNALLERRGARLALFVTEGFGDVLAIGDQQRPDLFALEIRKPAPLPEVVVEVPERIAADGNVLRALELDGPSGRELRERARALVAQGVSSAGVVLLHAWRNPAHEEALEALLRRAGFESVVRSSEVAPFLNLLRRAETTAAEGYLGPVVRSFVEKVGAALPPAGLHVMTSAGGLVRGDRVKARDTLLSGPAGGVVGAARVGAEAGFPDVIAFDMGGTSTDVSRHGGRPEYRDEHSVGDARLRAPALAIETVAAGGGSICALGPNGLAVGPESAGASPGPACYGEGGPLTLTDVNLLLGRVEPGRFGIPVDAAPARVRATELRDALARRTGESPRIEVLLEGFLELADERMADAIRKISVRKGYDPADHALVAFGGAGPQHACSVAARLGMRRVLVPADAGILSAVGLDGAVIERFGHREVLEPLDEASPKLAGWFEALSESARASVEFEGVAATDIEVRERTLLLRYEGQESTLEVPYGTGDRPGDIRRAFENAYRSVYGHVARERRVEVASLRVVAAARAAPSTAPGAGSGQPTADPFEAAPTGQAQGWLGGAWQAWPVHDRADLGPGAVFRGPALVLDRFSGTVVLPGWAGRVAANGTLVLEVQVGLGDAAYRTHRVPRSRAVEEELYVQRFLALVEEMGEQLRRTSISVNIRERLDFSCALLDPSGRLVANAPHIPVHLGALGLCVRRVSEVLELGPGDVAVTNHPGFGGSHLPDVTVVTPVFGSAPGGADAGGAAAGGAAAVADAGGGGALLGYVASRAHHAEFGGTRPGSMPPDARTLAEEGIVLAPRYLVRGGEADWDGIRALLTAPPHPSRAVDENLVDLAAQVAANHRGAHLLQELAGQAGGPAGLTRQMDALRGKAAARMREVLSGLPDGSHRAREHLDDGTPLQVEIRIDGDEARLDFTGSGPVHPGNLNATEAIVRSAVLYLLRVLAAEALPLNEGLMEPVRLVLPEGLLSPPFPTDPAHCPAVVGGNTETSQRLVDTLLKPFALVAGSQGTMNNVLFGDPTRAYYETVGGGAGAGPGFPGASAVQVHMTNTRITDTEVLEHRYPVRVRRFELRHGSGGEGRWHGGDGVIREIEFLAPLSLSVLGQHRVERPYGMKGGAPGAPGRQRLIRADGSEQWLAPIDGREVRPGDRLVLETPGGGGYGAPAPENDA
jgi:5-oxoprolinase (ATP-hydrolysing)